MTPWGVRRGRNAPSVSRRLRDSQAGHVHAARADEHDEDDLFGRIGLGPLDVIVPLRWRSLSNASSPSMRIRVISKR